MSRIVCMLGMFLGLAFANTGRAEPPKWKRIVIDTKFWSEGVAVADVNKDGKLDVLVGDLWFEAPNWKSHRIREGGPYNPKAYSNTFGCFSDDFNRDGWADLVVIPMPGTPCSWYENPKGKSGPWKKHILNTNACNETPQYADLFGTGKRVLIMAEQAKKGTGTQGQMFWYRPGKDPTKLWDRFPISKPSTPKKEIPGTRRFSHGLGVGDINGDGLNDVLCTAGWWQQPKKAGKKPWAFHAVDLGPNCADMFAFDMDGDGAKDVISSSAHNWGIWWHQQQKGKSSFIRRDLFPKLFSQTHAMHFVDVNGDGKKDLVTGRRRWAHNGRDPGGNLPPFLYWFEAKRNDDGSTQFIPHKIDDDSGIGTQFVVHDMDGDGDPDIVISNKKGVFVFLQLRPPVQDGRRE